MANGQPRSESAQGLAEGIAQEKVRSLQATRERVGDEAWAEELGSTVTGFLTVAHNPERSALANAVLGALAPQIAEVENRAELRDHFARGVFKELHEIGVLPRSTETVEARS